MRRTVWAACVCVCLAMLGCRAAGEALFEAVIDSVFDLDDDEPQTRDERQRQFELDYHESLRRNGHLK